MPQGLQIWNSSGNAILDVTDSLTRVLGMVQTSGGVNASGSLSDARLLTGRPWFTIVLQLIENYVPTVTIDGATISWSAEQYFPASPCLLIYGIY